MASAPRTDEQMNPFLVFPKHEDLILKMKTRNIFYHKRLQRKKKKTSEILNDRCPVYGQENKTRKEITSTNSF